MKYRLTLDKNVDFSPAAEVEEIFQNVRTILTTPKGTVPLLRDFGFSFEHLDKPIHLAQSLTRTILKNRQKTPCRVFHVR